MRLLFSSSAAMGLALLMASGGCLIGEHPFWDPDADTGNDDDSVSEASGDTTAPTSGTASGTTTLGSTSATTSDDETTDPGTTTGPLPTMGQPCVEDMTCDEGQMCGVAPEGMDACLIFCGVDQTMCPEETLCAHGYCLLRCSVDTDCSPWPGFTCQHNDTACENDEYDPKGPE